MKPEAGSLKPEVNNFNVCRILPVSLLFAGFWKLAFY
jgi:hypothetical protein